MSDTPPPPRSLALPGNADKQRTRAFQRLKRTGRARTAAQSAPSQPAVPAVRENQFPIQHSDWLQLREKVANLKEPVPYLASVGWTCIGITAGALLALPVWIPVDSKLSAKAHMHYTYMTSLLIIAAIAGTVIAAYTFAVGYQTKQMRVTTIKNVLADMDAIYEPYSHMDPGPADHP